MSQTKEIVLLPPSPSDTSAMALLADIQFLEPMASEAINRKFLGVVPKGIYRGFHVTAEAGRSLLVGASGPGTAVIERDGYCLTIQQQHPVSLPVGDAAFDGYVVLEGVYGVGVVTKQVSADSTIDAAQLLLVEKSARKAHQIVLCSVNVPAATVHPQILPSDLSTNGRDQTDLSGHSIVSGGSLGPGGTPGKEITIKSGVESDRLTSNLKDGELAFTTDGERISIGSHARPGGLLQPSAKWVEAGDKTALPQGKYLFTKSGLLQLPAAEKGEHVRVKASYIVAKEGKALVEDLSGQKIISGVGSCDQIHIDVVDELVFVKGDTQWTI